MKSDKEPSTCKKPSSKNSTFNKIPPLMHHFAASSCITINASFHADHGYLASEILNTVLSVFRKIHKCIFLFDLACCMHFQCLSVVKFLLLSKTKMEKFGDNLLIFPNITIYEIIIMYFSNYN